MSQERRCSNILNYTLTGEVLTPALTGSTDHVIKLPLIVLSLGAHGSSEPPPTSVVLLYSAAPEEDKFQIGLIVAVAAQKCCVSVTLDQNSQLITVL